jgi:hypothetical protein
MKKILFVAVLLIGSLTAKLADAQISFSLNIGSQPEWGPTGYDHADFYYMPDIDTYYDVPNHQYVYLNGNTWTRSGSLPPRYASYDVYHGYKAVINQPAPWRNAATYRAKYSAFKGRRNQQVIRDSRDAHYQNHWKGNNGNDNRGQNNRGQDKRGQDNRGQDKHGQDDRGHGHGGDHGQH